jgi:DNA-binding response OmpR family regulator
MAEMDVLFVSTRQETGSLLQYHLKPIGFEVRLQTDPAAVVTQVEADPPPIVLFDVDDFPRHWKSVLMHLRSFRSRSEAIFVLLTSREFSSEEAAKATHLGVNGIVTEDVSSKRGAHRLLDLLRRYKMLQDKRSFTRYLVTETDRVGLAFVHPAGSTLTTGEVTEMSVKGLSFLPDRLERCADLAVGTDLARCSLRVGDRIVSVGCKVMRAGHDLGLQFVTFDEGAHSVVRSYIQDRPERALHAAIEASRRPREPGPDDASRG